MPVYVFRCTQCATESELLLGLGDLDPRPCPSCGGQARHRLARVAVSYASWGFTATDRLVGTTRGKDFRALRETADKISDS